MRGRLPARPVCKHGQGPAAELCHTATSELERILTNLIGKYDIFAPRQLIRECPTARSTFEEQLCFGMSVVTTGSQAGLRAEHIFSLSVSFRCQKEI